MKSIDLFFKKAEISEFYSQLNQVKLRILFNDGKDKAIEKQITITDPTTQASQLLTEIRNKLKEQHKITTLEDTPLAGALILSMKQDAESVHEKLARFLAQTKERIHAGKMAKLSYYDLERKIRGFSATFDT